MRRGGIALALAGALAACTSLPDTPGLVSLTVAGPPIAAEETGQAYLYNPPRLPEGYDGGGIMAQHWSMLGREDKAAAADPGEYRATPCLPIVGSPEDYAGIVDTIVERARDHRVVIVNESHTVTRHRGFAARLLPELRKAGFFVLAAETFSHQNEASRDPVEQFADLPYPHAMLGHYSREPAFGRMLREARRLGYRLAAYEQIGDEGEPADADRVERIAAREAAQAKHLGRILADMRPDEKLLVHVGYSHANEADVTEDDGRITRWMAARLNAETGIDPLTIAQTECRTEGEAPFLAESEDGRFDILLSHPVERFIEGRVAWREDDTAVPIPRSFTAARAPLVIEAVREGEPFDAVPMDRVYVEPGEDIPLLLPPGRYSVRAVRLTIEPPDLLHRWGVGLVKINSKGNTMILKLAALGAIGYAGYKYYEKNQADRNGVAFADGQPNGAFRDAGSAATATPGDTMSSTDEALDETYPASDATAKY